MGEGPPKSAKISKEEQARRLIAARTLRGEDDRARFVREHGLKGSPVRDYEQAKRGIHSHDRKALAKALDFPEEWFTEPLDVLVGGRPEPSLAARLDRIEQRLDAIPDDLARVMDRLAQGPRRADPTSGESDNPIQTEGEGELPPALEQP